jgi:hypothetical protein
MLFLEGVSFCFAIGLGLGRVGGLTYEAFEEGRLLLALGAGEEADDGDYAVKGNGFEGLGLCGGYVSFDHFAGS